MHTRETLWELLQLRNTNFLIWSNGLDNITYFKLWCILWNTDFRCSVLSLEAKAGRPSKVCFGNNLWMQLLSDLIKTDEMEQIGEKWWRNLSETGRAMSQRAVWMNAVWWNSLCILSQQRSASSVHLCNQQDYWNRIERLWWYICTNIHDLGIYYNYFAGPDNHDDQEQEGQHDRFSTKIWGGGSVMSSRLISIVKLTNILKILMSVEGYFDDVLVKSIPPDDGWPLGNPFGSARWKHFLANIQSPGQTFPWNILSSTKFVGFFLPWQIFAFNY